MEFDFNIPLLDLSGKPVHEGLSVGMKLADMLMSENRGDALKLLHWSVKLWEGKKIFLEPADIEQIKHLVISSSLLPNIIKGRILEVISSTSY